MALLKRSRHYHDWHHHPKHKIVHISALAVVSLIAISFVAANLGPQKTKASGNGFTWSFETPSNYAFDSNKILSSSNNLQLKLTDTNQTFNVASGQLHNNTVYATTADNNYFFIATAAGIDVIKQSDHTSQGYIQFTGGFNTIAVVNGYLYAGRNAQGIWRWQISDILGATPVPDIRYSTQTSPSISSNNVIQIKGKFINGKAYLAVALSNVSNLIKDDQGSPVVLTADTSGWNCTAVALSDTGDLYYTMTGGDGAILAKYGAINMTSNWSYGQNDVDFGEDWTQHHGPNPVYLYPTAFYVNDLTVLSGTSTVKAGSNTIFVSTAMGEEAIQEDQVNVENGTIKEITKDALGTNLLLGASAQSRLTSVWGSPAMTIDGDYSSPYESPMTNNNWLEYDLGSTKSFNALRQVIYGYNTNASYAPKNFVVQSSTKGTSSNLATAATLRSNDLPCCGGSQAVSNANDGNVGTAFQSAYNISAQSLLLEADFDTDQSISGADMLFYNYQDYIGKNYAFESSTKKTSQNIALNKSVTTSSTCCGSQASNITDADPGSAWQSGQSTNDAPQWLDIDLGSVQDVAGTNFIAWNSDYAPKDYKIQYSTNDSDWSDAVSRTDNSQQSRRDVFSATVSARYVRLYMTTSHSPTDAQHLLIYDFQAYSSMFEAGTVTTLATVSNNTDQLKTTTFAPVTTQSIRINISENNAGNGQALIYEMRFYSSMFDGGTVTNLANRTNNVNSSLANNFSDVTFPSTTARYVRVIVTTQGDNNYLPMEVELYNSSMPNYTPLFTAATSYDSANQQMYLVNNSPPPEDGQITRLDNVINDSPTVGKVINASSSPSIPSSEVTAVDYVDANNLIIGTNSGLGYIGKRYDSGLPTVVPNDSYNPSPFANWLTFTESATKNGGEVYYQLSNDGGSTWNYWNGTAWVAADSTHYNTAVDVNGHIRTFGPGTANFKWKAFLASAGNQEVILNSVSLTYNNDSVAPSNPDSVVAKDSLGGSTTLADSAFGRYAAPSFSWNAVTDVAGTNAQASGTAGYYVYFGTDNTADPATAGSYQTGTTYTANGLASGHTYYLLFKTKDNANNVSDASTLFTYKLDFDLPTSPGFVSVSPTGYTGTNTYTFIWPATGDNAATDPGAPTTGSGVVGYQYKTGSTTGQYSDWSATITDSQIKLTDAAYLEGPNVFYIRAVDGAGNTSNPVQVTFYYSKNAPSAPSGLQVTPSSSAGSPTTSNDFAFSWTAPTATDVEIKQYHYSINALPTISNTSVITDTSLPAGPYATQQGKNTFYLVAEDEAGNVNYDIYSSVDFYTVTPAPALPTEFTAVDGSNRLLKKFNVFLTWVEPESKDSGFSGYEIYRSSDNKTFTSIGTTTATTYADTGLQSQPYWYDIKSKDNANQYSAASEKVTLTPTGRYTMAPALTVKPQASPKAFSATFTWETDRESSSFIEYGSDKDHVGKENGGKTMGALEQTKKHTVDLDGLQPETEYYYRAVWVDNDGNQGKSDSYSFTTGLRPKISNVVISNITLTSATVSWTSTTIATSSIAYGTTTAYGGLVTDKSGSQTTNHTVNLTDLADSSTYHFQVTGTDSDGNTLASDDYSFATLARPIINNLRFESVADAPTTSLQFTWTTNTPTTSIVNYTGSDNKTLSQANADYVTDHNVTISNLADKSVYKLQAKGVDKNGNSVVSDTNTFTTPNDSRPPKLSNMEVEVRASGLGSAQKAQIVVSWQTDEPGTSQIEYGSGISSDSYPQQSQEDPVYTTSHVVIVSELEPAKLYHLRAVSRDAAGNKGTSADTTAITGHVQESIIDLITNSLQQSFGFLGKFGNLFSR